MSQVPGGRDMDAGPQFYAKSSVYKPEGARGRASGSGQHHLSHMSGSL